MKYVSNQVAKEIIEQPTNWDDHTIVTWVYEGADVIYFLGQEGQYHVDIIQLQEDLLHKDISLTLYVNVMDKDNVFITWDHNGTSVNTLSMHVQTQIQDKHSFKPKSHHSFGSKFRSFIRGCEKMDFNFPQNLLKLGHRQLGYKLFSTKLCLRPPLHLHHHVGEFHPTSMD
jgi:hypothetical protein